MYLHLPHLWINMDGDRFFLIYLLIMLLQLSHFYPFTQLHPAHPRPPTFPPYSSCPWVIILISSLAMMFLFSLSFLYNDNMVHSWKDLGGGVSGSFSVTKRVLVFNLYMCLNFLMWDRLARSLNFFSSTCEILNCWTLQRFQRIPFF